MLHLPGIKHSPGALLMLALITLNLLAWGLAFYLFHQTPALMAASLLAWSYGLRHAVDADHIAAIDNVTRKMMQQGQRPCGIGAWFSLGHSTIVLLASMAIAAAASAFGQKIAWLHQVGSTIGTAISAFFLLMMALVNLVILRDLWHRFATLKRGESGPDDEQTTAVGGIATWLYRPAFRLVSRSWHMYLVGLLFGLGFDTATEIGVLGLSAVGAARGMSAWSIMAFPLLFASAMALVDSLDNLIMLGAYGWAFNKPQRKLYYNMTITATSVAVALGIGGLEALGLMADKFARKGVFWQWVGRLNDSLSNAGFVIVGLFILCWLVSLLNYYLRRYDALLSGKH
ncbi:high-affinity nickel-transport protein [Izhakiella capsodis]|uniref:Nickel/cobalt efflux system n=1 Tax=Izhakiella capsodis TaxID=1367852 RepID=A0A1I4ZQV6_9GAMM|nr:HoxN/HupN/NixA family nickel/cobalt transporter [Izhakiella capsodis]SFN52651.1 high-affinity nickel-transport protein [Izhakiella capsodis]